MSLFTQVQHEVSSLLTSYPEYILRQRGVPPGDVPVFVFHTIEHDRFEAQLQYLVGNGYRTIGMEEYLRLAQRTITGTGKEVLLTIDDARSSVWRFAFPLLSKYNCKAVLFAITGWTPPLGTRATLQEVWNGQKSLQEIAQIDPQDLTVCSWEELRAMRDAGVMEVESHTHLHQRLFAEPRLSGVITPTSVRTASDAAFSPYLRVADHPSSLPPDAFFGYPLCPTIPLMATQPSIEIDADFALDMSVRFLEQVQRVGEPTAARTLIEQAPRPLPSNVWRARSELETRSLARADLSTSQAALREGMRDPKLGKHLCLPFTIGSDTVVQIARELGFESILWGVNSARRSNAPGLDTMHTVRIKNDFIWRLPGKGRRALPVIYLNKATRRLAGVRPY